jgi:hypothetical protein
MRTIGIIALWLLDEGKKFIAVKWYHVPSEQHHDYWTFDRVLEK